VESVHGSGKTGFIRVPLIREDTTGGEEKRTHLRLRKVTTCAGTRGKKKPDWGHSPVPSRLWEENCWGKQEEKGFVVTEVKPG